jgi:intracellular sulfur oxidation DsrE/DsrF family protein
MNTPVNDYPETLLNAYIDGELDPAEHSRVLKATQEDEALSARVCELRRLHELVRHAYREPPPPAVRHHQVVVSPRFPRGIAAGLLAALCVSGGWFAHDALDRYGNAIPAGDEASFQAVRIDRPALAGHDVLMHINSGDPAHLAVALDTAERIARAHPGPDDHLIILANDGGLNLLRADVSPYPERVRALLTDHPNVTLIACRNAMDKLQNRLGTPVRLLPGASVGRTAVEEIVTRLRDGWLYVKA